MSQFVQLWDAGEVPDPALVPAYDSGVCYIAYGDCERRRRALRWLIADEK